MKNKKGSLYSLKTEKYNDYIKVFEFSILWVQKQFKVFNSNDLKKSYLLENEMPLKVNIFGAVFNNLKNQGYIFHHGFTNSKTKESKGCLIRTWISKEFKQKQAINASNKSTLKLFDDI